MSPTHALRRAGHIDGIRDDVPGRTIHDCHGGGKTRPQHGRTPLLKRLQASAQLMTLKRDLVALRNSLEGVDAEETA